MMNQQGQGPPNQGPNQMGYPGQQMSGGNVGPMGMQGSQSLFLKQGSEFDLYAHLASSTLDMMRGGQHMGGPPGPQQQPLPQQTQQQQRGGGGPPPNMGAYQRGMVKQ